MVPVVSHTDLISNYKMISQYCRSNDTAMFVDNNGVQELAVMSASAYKKLLHKLELYALLKDGLDDVNKQNLIPLKEALSHIRRIRHDRV